MEAQQLLHLQDLTLHFRAAKGVVRAVDGVDLELSSNRAVVILGESGCGKSSLMKTILGLNIPTSGDVIFDGENLSEFKGNDLQRYRFKVGYVQQDPYGALPPFMNVQRILEEPLVIRAA
jgi:peptide/nickel transport system ATP-binding protein